MRAGGLLVGIGVLAAGWVVWLVESAGVAPAAPAAAAVRADPRPARAPRPRPAVEAPPGVPTLPVLAELDDGAPLTGALRDLGRSGRLTMVVGELPPGLGLLTAPGSAAVLIAPAPRDQGAWIADLAASQANAWVSVFDGDLLLASRRLVPGQTLLRFVLDQEHLRELVGAPPST